MKMAISGKGGSGKSTITALLAKSMAKRGYKVLVIDMDESNMGLHRYLGMPEHETLLAQLGGKQEYGKRVQAARFAQKSNIFDQKWSFDDLPKEMVSENNGIKLLSMGKVQKFGEGCACPIGTLSKQFFDNLVMGEGDVLIMDTAAGVEHFGRSVEKGFDCVLIVVDPSFESTLLSRRIEEMSHGQVKKTFYVLNKADGEAKDIMLTSFDKFKIAAVVPVDKGLFSSSLKGEEIKTPVKEVDELATLLESEFEK